jgi:hypothetical protein
LPAQPQPLQVRTVPYLYDRHPCFVDLKPYYVAAPLATGASTACTATAAEALVCRCFVKCFALLPMSGFICLHARKCHSTKVCTCELPPMTCINIANKSAECTRSSDDRSQGRCGSPCMSRPAVSGGLACLSRAADVVAILLRVVICRNTNDLGSGVRAACLLSLQKD